MYLHEYVQGYGSAKAGLIGLTHAQAVSLSPRRVNVILPGAKPACMNDEAAYNSEYTIAGTDAVRCLDPTAGYIYTEDEDPETALGSEDHAWHLTGANTACAESLSY